jgi:hypothetical protein
MRKWVIAIAVLLFSTSGMLLAIEKATLTGKVTDTAGKPLAHATVVVYHAGVKRGYSTFCPSCYADCGKRTITDSHGAYTLNGLNPALWFDLLVVHDGYTPTFVKKVDPLKGLAAIAALDVRVPVSDPSSAVRGRVVNQQGTPVRDAVVTPKGLLVARDGSTIYGTIRGLDPIAVTNEKGEFEIAYSKPAVKMALMVEPRAMAPKLLILPTALERQTVTVSDGAVVRGRLVENGKPVAGAEIGLNSKEPWFGMANLMISGSFYDEVRIGTQEDGTFAITNVPAPEEWNIYAKMESIASLGATDPVAFSTTHDNQEVNVGDIPIKHSYRLRGKVALSDHKPIPHGMTIFIASARDRDTQTTSLAADGVFEFLGLVAGTYTLGPSVEGYEAPKGKSEIEAIIDHDLDGFTINLEPVRGDSIYH